MPDSVATVTVSVTDIGLMSKFIVSTCRADGYFRSLAKDEMLALPDRAVQGICELQSAIDCLRRSQEAGAEEAGAAGHVPGDRPPRY